MTYPDSSKSLYANAVAPGMPPSDTPNTNRNRARHVLLIDCLLVPRRLNLARVSMWIWAGPLRTRHRHAGVRMRPVPPTFLTVKHAKHRNSSAFRKKCPGATLDGDRQVAFASETIPGFAVWLCVAWQWWRNCCSIASCLNLPDAGGSRSSRPASVRTRAQGSGLQAGPIALAARDAVRASSMAKRTHAAIAAMQMR